MVYYFQSMIIVDITDKPKSLITTKTLKTLQVSIYWTIRWQLLSKTVRLLISSSTLN